MTTDRRRLAPALLLALALLATLPATVLGHASLSATTPASDAVVDTPPGELALEFGGLVTVDEDDLALIAPDGKRRPIDAVSASGETTVTVTPPDDLARGTHTLAWTAYTDHGEPLRGLLPFHVGERTGGDADAARAAARSDAERARADERRSDLLRIALPALLVALVLLVVLALRPAWRLPTSLALIVVVVLALGVARRTDDGSDVRVGETASTRLAGGEPLELTVDPARVGANHVTVEVGDAADDGSPIERVELRAMPEDDELGAIRVPLQADGDGRFVLHDQTIPLDGTWTMAVNASRASGEGQQVTFIVPIKD